MGSPKWSHHGRRHRGAGLGPRAVAANVAHVHDEVEDSDGAVHASTRRHYPKRRAR